jgi:hypothetical protein
VCWRRRNCPMLVAHGKFLVSKGPGWALCPSQCHPLDAEWHLPGLKRLGHDADQSPHLASTYRMTVLLMSVRHAQGQLPFVNRLLHYLQRWWSGRSERRVGKGRPSPCNFRLFRVKIRRRVIVIRSSVRWWNLKRLKQVQLAVSGIFPNSVQ